MKRIQPYAFIALLLILSASAPPVGAQTQGSSPSAPMPTGSALDAIIECGEGYTAHELYDARITLIEFMRGEDAWKRIQAADAGNQPAGDGFEYVLVRAGFSYQARGLPGTCIHTLSPEHFTAFSALGEGYGSAGVLPPMPQLYGKLKSGESFEGWLVFKVARRDKAPLVYYSIDEGGGTQHGGGKWFIIK